MNKRKTLWDRILHPEPVDFDERMEGIENRSYIWGYRLYTIFLLGIGMYSYVISSDSDNIVGMLLLAVAYFLLLGKTLYRCYYGILEVQQGKRNRRYGVINGCFALGFYNTLYISLMKDHRSNVWIIIVYVIGMIFFYLLCHIMYNQYLKSSEDNENGKRGHSEIIGVLCAIALGIFLLGPVVNSVLNNNMVSATLTKEEVNELEEIQKAVDAYRNLDTYRLECFYENSNEDTRPIYSNQMPGHSYYWRGSKESFALVLDDSNVKKPVVQANYLLDNAGNQGWSIYHDGRWIPVMDYDENLAIPSDTDEERAYIPTTGILDIEPKSVENISMEYDENGYKYIVTFNDKYETEEEYLGRIEKTKEKRQAVEVYRVNDFGVMTGYELRLTTYAKDRNDPILESTKFNLLSANRVEIDEEIKKLADGKFEEHINLKK